jgi:hypothetical protein
MKKTWIIALALGMTGAASAQDLTSKKGEPILPEEGDWSIGIHANPFLNYFGNFFGGANTAPSFNFSNFNQTITGKYFVTPQTAYRASLRIGVQNETRKSQVDDRSFVPQATNNFPNLDPMKENTWKRSGSNIGLAVGIEKRKGKTRLQGYYGGEVGIGFSSSKDRFTYGNALTPAPATTVVDVTLEDEFTDASNVDIMNFPGAFGNLSRITERNNGARFSFGVRGFIGVEYFLLPKISLGGEFGWGLGFVTGGKTTTVYETIGNNGGGAQDVVGKTQVESPGGSSLTLDTDNRNSLFGPSAALRLNFHF